MTPIDFPEANQMFGPPKGMAESQVMTIPAHVGQVRGGTCDGAGLVVVAWKPSAQEVEAIVNGAPVYLSCVGGLIPHFLTTDFHAATHPR